MTSTEKKYKNREYYQSNREVIKNRARERYHLQKKREDNASSSDAQVQVEALTLVVEAKNSAQSEPEVIRLYPSEPWIGSAVSAESLDFGLKYEISVVTQNLTVEGVRSHIEPAPDVASSMAEIPSDAAEQPELFQLAPEKVPLAQPMGHLHTEKQGIQTENSAWLKGFLRILSSPSLFFQVLFITGLTSILTAMQIGFYRAHDIFPELAVPLAVACELSLLYLVSIRRRGISNWMRIGIYALLFGYIVSSLSFDVFFQSRNQLKESVRQAPGTGETRSELREDLKQAQVALDTSIKGRSWKNMALFGEQVSSIQKRISEFHETKELGVTDSEATFVGAVLLVALRGLLMGVNSMAVCVMTRRRST